MVKIKTTKKFTLPELIQWGWDNPRLVESKWIKQKGTILEGVYFSKLNRVVVRDFVSKDDTFTVEFEEEITEETVIPMLIEVTEYNDNTNVFLNENKSIKTVLDDSLNDLFYDPKAFYTLSDDMTMTLIWRNGEMVE